MPTWVFLAGCGALSLALLVVALAVPRRVSASLRAALLERLDAAERSQERLERALRDDLAAARGEAAAAAGLLREEVRATLRDAGDSTVNTVAAFGARLDGFTAAVEQKLQAMQRSNEARLDALRLTVDARLAAVQEESGRRLEQMRQTVDEKLQGTLERRLGESFKLVGDRLEAVQRGLGEMQTLASGVGDLKKVLTNVKTRGTWGEVQLGSLLEQILAPEQYAANVAPRKEGGERVEFAVRLPGREEGQDEVLLPIDSKFPVADYQRLVEASERGDAAAVEASAVALEAAIEKCARDIRDKYLNPPRTTDFAILFVPTEGLYAEVLRRPGLAEALQRECKVVVAGPMTLAAVLNSLQMGFRTLAIQKRSSEVWQVLGAVKTEFGKFGQVLDKVEKKLHEASNTISDAARRRRALERKLKTVEALPAADATALLPELASAEEVGEEEAVS